METLARALAVASAGCILALVIKKNNPEFSLLLSIAAAGTVTALAAGLLGEVMELIELARSVSGLSSAIVSPVIKCVGLGCVTRLGSDLCRDAGQSAAASALELTGCAATLCAAMPLFRSLIAMIERIA